MLGRLGVTIYWISLLNVISPQELQPGCIELHCPEHCELTFLRGCPHNCNCRKPRTDCPDIGDCSGFGCIVRTTLDRCQECVCGGQIVDGTGNVVGIQPGLGFEEPGLGFEEYGDYGSGTEEDHDAQEIFTFPPAPTSSSTTPQPVPATTIIQRQKPEIKIRTEGTGSCLEAELEEIDLHLSHLAEQAEHNGDRPAFPPTYFLDSHAEINSVCHEYKNSLAKISGRTIRVCRGNYKVLDSVLATFDLPCGFGSHYTFMRVFECIKSIRSDDSVFACESEAKLQVQDERQTCAAYSTLIHCLKTPLMEECGIVAYEMHKQYLSLYVRRFSPGCTLTF